MRCTVKEEIIIKLKLTRTEALWLKNLIRRNISDNRSPTPYDEKMYNLLCNGVAWIIVITLILLGCIALLALALGSFLKVLF